MRVLVTGASGNLGPYVVDELRRRGWRVSAWRGRCDGPDLTNADDVVMAFASSRPDAVLHLAAMAKPAEAQKNPSLAESINVKATALLSDLAHDRGARFVYLSTDLAFDGTAAPYAEASPPTPLSVYARSKVEAEAGVLASGGAVVRVSLMYGPGSAVGGGNFFDQQSAALREGRSLRLFHDEFRTPLALGAAASGLAALLAAEGAGLYHLGGPERMSRVDFAQRLARHLGVAAVYETCSRLEIGSSEPRPADVSLDSSKFCEAFGASAMWTMEDALRRMGV